MDAQTYTGRPSKNADFKLYDGKLYQVLLEKLPSKFIKFGRVDTLKLSEATGNARFTVYRWLNDQVLSRKAIHALLKLSQETDEAEKKDALTKEDLIPFALGL
ncbi:hypothetical protein NKJ28_00210 [Mesorhizobium sp. M0145]|uniref:hypothetical protein n=1 Tax=unclassified Mesorhizobium TaxID=325217 RepID=UPI00333B0CEA